LAWWCGLAMRRPTLIFVLQVQTRLRAEMHRR
jgi:hypothetical protein